MATQAVSGTVKNDSGQTVAGASVTAKNMNTEQIVSSTTSNSAGRFALTVTAGSNDVITAMKDGVWLSTELDPDDGVTTKSGLNF